MSILNNALALVVAICALPFAIMSDVLFWVAETLNPPKD